MTDAPQPRPPTLADCADEPIHIPGAIQPFGALLVFDHDHRLLAESTNAAEILEGVDRPALGVQLAEHHLDGRLPLQTIRELRFDRRRTATAELALGDSTIDLVARISGDLLHVDCERRPSHVPDAGPFGLHVHGICRQLQEYVDIDGLLAGAASSVRSLTGFDRVMCYRFQSDGSGEVVAEARRADLEPLLGLRYPASDIPAQARRLYSINPIRLIPDVLYRPVAIEPHLVNGQPIDLSSSVLRSVSPIHVEYLGNMGVRASMSISLVVDGELWGLIACHHYQPLQPAYSVRVACLVLSDLLSLLIARHSEKREFELVHRSSRAREAIVERVSRDEDLLRGLIDGQPSLLDVLDADGVAVSGGGRIATRGIVPPRETLARIVAQLKTSPPAPVQPTDSLAGSWGEELAAPGVAGMLTAEYHHDAGGYILWFREEQIRRIRWAGDPDKAVVAGPNGTRLTPRGSFDVWREEVRDRARPWRKGELEVAGLLAEQVRRIALARVSHVQRVQNALIGSLGHDLRTPLNAIAISASLLDDSGNAGELIRNSTNRMSNLVRTMLDFSVIEHHGELTIETQSVDLEQLVRSIIGESMVAHPGAAITMHFDGPTEATVDPTRVGQLVSNLLSNASHHGKPGTPIQVVVAGAGAHAIIEVTNFGDPIPEERRDSIFEAFRTTSSENRSRMGLGLYICRAVARAHDGTIGVECTDSTVTFRAVLRRQERQGSRA